MSCLHLWKILDSCYSIDFVNGMRNRVIASHYKYGDLKKTKRDINIYRDELKNAKARIKAYEETGNPEYLIDASNFLMFEFMEMQGDFIATDGGEYSRIV